LYLYLGVTLALVAALAFSHFTVYRWGKNEIRKEWLAATAAANVDSRKLEQQRQRRADEAQSIAAGRSASLARAVRLAGDSADSLYDTLDATERMAAQSHDAATKAVSALRAVSESCTAEYRAVGQEAQGHANDSLMYQEAWPR
jgi:hypothetical protein